MAGTTYTSFDATADTPAALPPASPLREDYAGWPYRGGTDPDAFGFGTVHGYGGGPVGIATGTTADRKGGRDLPIFWSEVDLRAFRVIARQLDSTNFFGIGFMNLLVAYGVRKGYGWQACKVGAEKTAYATTAGKQEPVVEKAQAILDEFRSKEQWPLKSREAWRRWRRDGEAFGRFFYGGYGRLPRHRFVEPEQIGSPTGSTDDDDSFGIRNLPGDVTIPEEYFVREMGTADIRRGQWIDAARIVHIKANVDSTIKRGVTDFLPVTATLADVARLLRNLTGTSIEQTKYAWWERFPTATVGQVQGLLGQIGSDQRRPGVNGPNVPYWYDNANTNSMTSLPPGSVLRTEGSREIDATPGPANAEAHIAILQAGLRGCCVRWGAPEYASGDASNNNMASATVAGGLFPTVMEGEQMAFGTQWERESALRVLDLATEAGLLSHAERSQLDVEVTEPAVVTPEPDKDATRVIGLVNARLLSPQTAQLQLQLDPQHEAENWTAWDAANPPQAQPGMGGPGGGDPPPDSGGTAGGGGVREGKDAAGHDHKGKGAGGGQFTGGGGGGGTAKTKPKPTPTKPVVTVKDTALTLKVKPTKTRAFTGEPVTLKTPISKQDTGKIGEAVVVAWLKSKGMADAGAMNIDRNNFPIDLIQDHETIEAKTGLASNSKSAQQWRLTIGQPGKEESAWLAAASPEEKAAWNARKQKEIHARKQAVLDALGKEVGHEIKAATVTVILNPDTKTADIYKFTGWHDRIAWGSDEAKAGYVESVTYA